MKFKYETKNNKSVKKHQNFLIVIQLALDDEHDNFGGAKRPTNNNLF